MSNSNHEKAINSDFNRIVKERSKTLGGIRNVNFTDVYTTIAREREISVMTVRRVVNGY